MAIITIQGAEERRRHVHYEVDTKLPPIGAGGMGQVMRGVLVDEATGVRRDAAVKFLFDDLPDNAIERSRREASIRISNENLVEMFGFIEVETTDASGARHTRYHVASELLRGVMLHDLMRGKTTDADGVELPFAADLYRQYSCDRLRFAVFIIRNVLSGVMALHDAGYIHRDIDPSNIMVTADGKVKLIDFGICKPLDPSAPADRHLTTTGQFMGKAAYAAPELVTGDVAHQNATTDLYAIGIMLFELITGHVPFDGATHDVLARQLKEDVPVKNIPDTFARKVVKKATEKKQEKRYASAAEFRVAVEQLSRNSVTPADRHTAAATPATGSAADVATLMGGGRKKALIGGAATAAVVVAVIIAVSGGSGATDAVGDASAGIPDKSVVEARRAEIADMIIDDMAISGPIDTITGMEIPTAGALIAKAREQLRSESTAGDGVALLRKVADRNMKSSAEALALLAALSSQSKTLDSTVIAATSAIFTTRDYTTANRLNSQALSLDADNYRANFEIGCDYISGKTRGVVDRDFDRAATHLVKSRKAAEAGGDAEFVAKIDEVIELLKSEGVEFPS